MHPDVTEVADGVFHVEGACANWQIVVDGNEVTLVDTAWPRDFGMVTASLEQVGRSPADVAAIVLTHAHVDHIGTAAEFHDRFGTPVHAHTAEAPHARGEVVEQVSTGALLVRIWRPSVIRFVLNVMRHGGTSATRVSDVETFEEGAPLDLPGGPVPVATPGHTSGHCSFHLPERGVVLAGDVLVTHDILRDRSMVGPMPVFDHDPERSRESMRRLAELEAQVLLPGHGPPFHGTPAEAVERALGTRR